MDRREFLFTSLAFSTTALAAQPQPPPLRFGHRQANMVTAPGQDVFDLASHIPGLSGVELQMIWKGQDLSDGLSEKASPAAAFKDSSHRNSIIVPSIAGIWKPGETIFDLPVAEKAITNAIRTCEFFRAQTILIALYNANCPDMSDEKSFGPVVTLLQKLAPRAASANVRLGLETSLTPTDENRLLALVDRPALRTYYDITNEEDYHPGVGVPGIEILGPRIVQCHLKNQDRLLTELPSKVDWVAAFKAFKKVHYNGWYVFETKHATPERCITDTQANIAFVRSQLL
jgi:sugar phosphate isomerase/epimerase